MKEAVYRHYYKKLKKILRGKAIPQYNDFSPGDLLFRGQARAQTDELLKSGATKSNGSGVVSSLGDKDKTYATTRLKLARVFAGRGAAFTETPDGYKRHAGEIISFVKQKDPGYQQARKRLGSFRDTSKPSMRQGSIDDDVLALRNPIMKDELRGILVKQGGAKHGYRPLTLREAKERGLSAKLRLRELAAVSLRLIEFRMVAPVSVSKLGDAESRKALVKSVRRFLEKQKGVDRNAVRSAMGAKPMRGEITTRKQSIMDTRRAFLDRAANKKQNADLVEAGFRDKPSLKLIPDFRDPDFEQKAARLDRLRRLAERASKNKKYQALTGNAPGYVSKRNAAPRLAMVNGNMSLLTYRGIAEGGSYPVLKRKLSRPRDGWNSPEARTPVRHTLRASGGLASQPTKASGAAMSMTTNPAKADEFASGAQGAVGVYGVQLRKLLKEAREGNLSGKPGSKIAMVNKEFPSEREISQATGGNLLAVRKYKYNNETGMRERA